MNRIKSKAAAITPLVFAIFGAIFLGGSAASAADNCSTCHENNQTLQASVHASLSCTSCHTDVKSGPHSEPAAKVKCGSCHADGASGVAASVHAKAGPQPCLNCHGGAHEILSAKNPKSPTYPSNLPRTCGVCHGNAETAKKFNLKEVYSLYMDSIHGFALTKGGLLVAASCSSCHGAHNILSSKNPKSRTNHANVPATCGGCHAAPLEGYSASIHGQALAAGLDGAPVCSDCHSAHQIKRVGNAEWQMKTTATCGGCHKEELATYRDTFHSRVSALGFEQTARCADCHGPHKILPASDPESKVASANLIATCGACHQGANAGFVKYDPHGDHHDRKRYPALYFSTLFMNLLLASVLGFFALHTLIWFIRSKSGNGA